MNRFEMEENVRKILGGKFGVRFDKKNLDVGTKRHEFDLVSADESIIGEVKTSEPNKHRFSKNLRTAQLGDLSRDCLLLAARESKQRILALTDRVVCQRFLDSEYGEAAKKLGIDIMHVQVD